MIRLALSMGAYRLGYRSFDDGQLQGIMGMSRSMQSESGESYFRRRLGHGFEFDEATDCSVFLAMNMNVGGRGYRRGRYVA